MNEPLPPPGKPFAIGNEVAFFPAEIAPPNNPGWFRWSYAVIDDINEPAESFGFHFVSQPGVRQGQRLRNIVRRTPRYERWRTAYERALAEGTDPDADPEVR